MSIIAKLKNELRAAQQSNVELTKNLGDQNERVQVLETELEHRGH